MADTHDDRLELGLCLSGGGFRASLFHGGVLIRLNECGLLSRLDLVSSVSGGSIASGLLASVWPRLNFDDNGCATNFEEIYVRPLTAFCNRSIDLRCILRGLLNPFSSAAREVEKIYRRHLFGDISLKQLPNDPWFIFCASNLSTGSLFRMSKRYVADYRIGIAPTMDMPLAQAVAASSAFPPFLSPLRLTLSPTDWAPDDLDARVGLPATDFGRAVLTDGGVYDNHGLEPVLKRCRWILVSDAGAPWAVSRSSFGSWFAQLRRVIDTTDNQVRALRRRDLIARFKAGQEAADLGVSVSGSIAERAAVRGTYWSLTTDPAKYPAPKPLAFPSDRAAELARLPTRLKPFEPKDSNDLLSWGYFVSDVALRSHFDSGLPLPIALPRGE